MKLGKGRVIFTPLDVTSGLIGTNTWGILGYTPEYAEAMVTNSSSNQRGGEVSELSV